MAVSKFKRNGGTYMQKYFRKSFVRKSASPQVRKSSSPQALYRSINSRSSATQRPSQSTANPGTAVEAAMPTYNEVRREVHQMACATFLIRVHFLFLHRKNYGTTR